MNTTALKMNEVLKDKLSVCLEMLKKSLGAFLFVSGNISKPLHPPQRSEREIKRW